MAISKLSTIELYREDLKFSAGHFTIFSATQRENLHGHNYQVYAALTTLVADNGLSFDYRHYHQQLAVLCGSLNLTFLLPTKSKYLRLEEQGEYYHAYFNQEMLPFLKKDVVVLPIANTTVEELSAWFLQQLLQNTDQLEQHAIQAITIKVSSNAGRSGSANWAKFQEVMALPLHHPA